MSSDGDQLHEISQQIATVSAQLRELKTLIETMKPAREYHVAIGSKVLLSRKDAAGALSISLTTLDQLITQGELSVRRLGQRILISRKELEQLASRRDVRIVWPQPHYAKAERLAGRNPAKGS